MVKRSIEKHLKSLARQYPVVTMTGPRQSGKTTICKSVFKNKPYISFETPDTREFAMDDPRGFLKKYYKSGAVFDEIQRVPDLPSYLQGIVDERKQPGQYILTGSQQFSVIDSVNQSLAGRTALLKLLPFSVEELETQAKKRYSINDFLYRGFFREFMIRS